MPEESCLSYLACSDDSDEGFCPLVRNLTSCTMDNACRRKTCIPDNYVDDMHSAHKERREGGAHNDDCQDVIPLPGSIPNVTIAEYGSIEAGNIHAIQAEIYARYGCILYRFSANFSWSHYSRRVSQTLFSLSHPYISGRGPVKTSINAWVSVSMLIILCVRLMRLDLSIHLCLFDTLSTSVIF